MSRNPGNADTRMLEAAKTIVSKDGCSGLRVRDVVKRAGVNLGMFHYHFKSKERFKRQLLQEFYEDFFARLCAASKKGGDPVGRLRNTLLAMGRFIRDHREFYLSIFKDVLNDDPDVFEFIRSNISRHGGVIASLIQQGQKEGSLAKVPLPQAMSFLMTSMSMPILIGGTLEKRQGAIGAFDCVLSDHAIAQRIDFALKGLKP